MKAGKTTKSDLVNGICERLDIPVEKEKKEKPETSMERNYGFSFPFDDDFEEVTVLDRAHVLSVVDELFRGLKEAIIEGSTIELRGFGTFEVRLRKGKKSARNPKNGEIVSVAPHFVAAFRPGQEIKKRLWEIPVDGDDDDDDDDDLLVK